MKKIYTKTPSRFFAFGCSFTNHTVESWADIIAYELKVPFYNYGRGGAGNQYIFNAIMQADLIHKLTEDDLVMVCWTSVCREDRYLRNHWHTPGNIFSQDMYDAKYIKQWADPLNYSLRDFAVFKAVADLLKHKNIEHHFMKMIDFDIIDQWEMTQKLTSQTQYADTVVRLLEMYRPYLDNINKSFYEILWNNNLTKKFETEKTQVHNKFRDGHPDIREQLSYLQSIFDTVFSKDTVCAVDAQYIKSVNQIRISSEKYNGRLERIQEDLTKNFKKFSSPYNRNLGSI
jgi:hypothetical protein